MVRKLLLTAALASAAGLGLLGVSRFSAEAVAKGAPHAGGARSVSVQVATARTTDLAVVLTGLGSVVASRSVTVRSRVAGQLVRVSFREGETVERGQVLAELDDRVFAAKVREAEGLLARDRALLRNARAELARVSALRDERLVSEQQIENQTSLVEQYEAAERVSAAHLEAAKLELEFTRVRAPIRGRVGFRQVDVGNNIGVTDPIAVIHELEPIAVVFTLREDDVHSVLQSIQQVQARGEALEVEAWDKGSRALIARGRLVALDNQIDAATGTIQLKAEFDNGDGALYPSQFVNVRFVVDTLKDVTVVPAAAIQRGREGPFVYVVDEAGVAHVRPVELGLERDAELVVRAGLSPGERVVTQGADQLRDGAQTTPFEASSATPSGAASRPATRL